MVGSQHSISVALALAEIHEEIQSRGLTYRESFDFNELRDVCDTLECKILTDQFDGSLHDLHAHNAFWIGLYNGDGDCIAIQAAMLIELGRMSLAQFWALHQLRRCLNLRDPGECALGQDHCPLAFEISGQVAYHGEFWVREDYRGSGLTDHFGQFGLFASLLRWNFDWAYGMMESEHAYSGLSARCGFRSAEPRAIDWVKCPKSAFIQPDDWLIAASRQNVEHSAMIVARDGVSQGVRRGAGRDLKLAAE